MICHWLILYGWCNLLGERISVCSHSVLMPRNPSTLFSKIQRLLEKVLPVRIVFNQAGFIKCLNQETERLHQTGILHIWHAAELPEVLALDLCWRACGWSRLKERMEAGWRSWKKRREEDKDFSWRLDGGRVGRKRMRRNEEWDSELQIWL